MLNAAANPFGAQELGKRNDLCPNKHALTENMTPVAGFSCNRCTLTRNAPAGSRFFSCRTCDFDVCQDCYLGRRAPAADQPAPKLANLPDATKASSEPASPTSGPSGELLKQIQAALENPTVMQAHARAWFKRFDADVSGTLDIQELLKLCNKLNSDLAIPQVEPAVIEQLLKKFDTDDDHCLNLQEFNVFYVRLLMTVKEHYGGFKVKRAFFLNKREGKPEDRYKVRKQVGHGSFGVVSLVEDTTTKRQMVLKTINKQKSRLSPAILEQEFKNLVLLDHPHVIKVFDYYEDYLNVYVIMELAEAGELLSVVEKSARSGQTVDEAWARSVFEQVIEAVAYCHSRGVMHKDLKSENILLIKKDPVHAVVIDFGLAEAFSHSNARSDVVSGTPYTMAPEVWSAAIRKGSIGYKCDVYSIGCVLFHVLSGNFPILVRGNDPAAWLMAIKRGPDWSKLAHCSKNAIDLCKRMMSIREDDRPTARQCLAHPWFGMQPDQLKTKLSSQQINSLAAFAERSHFEKTVLLQVATLARAADMPNINAIFRALDQSSDGVLDRQRCTQALVKIGVPAGAAGDIAKALDADGNNHIEYSEFVAGIIGVYDDHINNLLWGVFSRLDIDGSGQLDANEIRHMLKKGELSNLGLAPTDSEIDKIFKAIDKDKSGKVSYDEFRDFIFKKK